MREWIQIIIIFVALLLIMIVGLLAIAYRTPRDGKRYSIEDKTLHIYNGRDKTKEIPLSDIGEVTVYHSWLDTWNARLGGSYTVCVNYAKDKQLRFHISKYDAPDYEPNSFNQITDYAFPATKNRAKKHLIEELRSKGIKVKCKYK